ncbi:MAG TPA: flavin reductase family protein [Candidatus Kryptonia bacterium]|nr:flavin reductase family protein [Candidatus Kryptonia bacterium]
MPIDKNEFRKVCGQFAAGVTVVTTVGADGAPYGLTATAFSSVSLDPPLVLVCVDKKSETYPHFGSGVFAVNFLALDQQHLSKRFATSGGDKFDGVEFRRGELGAPLLAGAIGHLECRIVHVYAGGDHTIYVGEVDNASVRDGEPLLHFRGAYGKITQ